MKHLGALLLCWSVMAVSRDDSTLAGELLERSLARYR